VPDVWEQLVGCLEAKESREHEHAPEEWEPIETAPMDGTPIRVRRDTVEALVFWSDELQAWVIGLATVGNHLAERVLPWRPISWAHVPGALEQPSKVPRGLRLESKECEPG
jgi:hypothetical protein